MKKYLQKQFQTIQTMDFEILKYFLGIEVTIFKKSIFYHRRSIY